MVGQLSPGAVLGLALARPDAPHAVRSRGLAITARGGEVLLGLLELGAGGDLPYMDDGRLAEPGCLSEGCARTSEHGMSGSNDGRGSIVKVADGKACL
jgi:hypothetical protein